MNITKYINSIDLARYLEKIGYEFTSKEAAYLIWQSRKVSLAAKHDGWNLLIDTMPDCILSSRWGTQTSLHSLLKKYMRYHNRLLDRFFTKEDGYYYRFRYLLTHSDNDWEAMPGYYPDYQRLYDELTDKYDGVKYHFEIIREKIPGDMGDMMILHLYGTEIIMDIRENITCEDGEALENIFSEMWMNIPTPFQKGDVLVSPYGPYGGGFSYDNNKHPFVVTHICTWDENPRFNDNTDMTASGYFLEEDGGTYAECIHNYLDCEYYRGDFGGRRRLLNLLSLCVKGEIDIGLCVRAYHMILAEEDLKNQKKFVGYTKEVFDMVGIERYPVSPVPTNPYAADVKSCYTVLTSEEEFSIEDYISPSINVLHDETDSLPY